MDQIPVTSRHVRILLWTSLALSFTTLAFSLVNFGFTSLFIGLSTACGSIIHISTHLIIIRVRERRASRTAPTDLDGTQMRRTADTGLLPPTSTLPSIIFACILVLAFIAGFIVSTLILVLGDEFLDFTITRVVPFEIIFEALSAIALLWLVIIGIRERKMYLEVTRRIKLEDIPPA